MSRRQKCAAYVTNYYNPLHCSNHQPPLCRPSAITLHHIVLNKTGRSPAAHPDLLTLRFRNRRGKFFPEYMEGVYGLCKQVSDHRAREWRLRVGYIEIMACMLAVRTTIRQVRHGHILSWRHGIDQTAARQLRRLEALRKRLKRLITKTKRTTFLSRACRQVEGIPQMATLEHFVLQLPDQTA